MTTGWNLPFLEHTFQRLDPRSETRYGGCSAEDIAAYTRPVPSLRSQSSKVDATRWLTNFPVDQWPSQKVGDALNHIGQVLSTPVWGPDMHVQISRNLDTAFFDGRLRESIKVSSEDVHTTPSLGSDLMEALGVTRFDEDDNICYILLNRYAIQGGQIDTAFFDGLLRGRFQVSCELDATNFHHLLWIRVTLLSITSHLPAISPSFPFICELQAPPRIISQQSWSFVRKIMLEM